MISVSPHRLPPQGHRRGRRGWAGRRVWGGSAAFCVSSASKALARSSQKLKLRKREATNRACEGDSRGAQRSVVLDRAPQASPPCLGPPGSGPGRSPPREVIPAGFSREGQLSLGRGDLSDLPAAATLGLNYDLPDLKKSSLSPLKIESCCDMPRC